MKTIAVIGLGKFGFYIAKSLSKLDDFTVIAADNNAHTIQEMSEYVENAFILDSTNKQALEEVGIVDLDTVIVSIGENIEASILTVMALKDLGNKNIIAKAITTTHGEILAKLGASRVLHPEKIAGRILVHDLADNINFEEIDLSNSMRILKLKLSSKWENKTIQELIDIAANVKLIAFKTDGDWTLAIEPSHLIKHDDIFAFLSDAKTIEGFYSLL